MMRATRTLFRPLTSFAHAKAPTPRPQSLYLTHRQPLRQLQPLRHLQPLSSCSRRLQSHSSELPYYSPDSSQPEPPARPQQPSYELTFTCKPCQLRSKHLISKQGYHRGTVVVSCPSCKSRHIISDHLNIFSDDPQDIEKIMEQHGEKVKKGVLGKGRAGEDIELWDDGTETPRYMPQPEADDVGQQDKQDTGQQEAGNTARFSP